jgi:Na+/H+ antiporter NhaA
VTEFGRYLRTETVGGFILLVATALALIAANGPWADAYQTLRDTEVGPHLLHLDLTVGDWAKDGLLALFFFVAGLELKRELVIGELSRLKNALLPVIAAFGGMVVPALVATGIGWGDPRMTQAWAVPVATDIAFALGVLALAASGLPSSARLFLLSLAVVDDLGALLLIAILFTGSFDLPAAGAAVVLLALYWFLQRKRIRTPWLYVPVVVATWVAVHESGMHATIAGVALALLTRVRTDPGEDESPCLRLEHRLQPWSAGLAVPVFAFFAGRLRRAVHRPARARRAGGSGGRQARRHRRVGAARGTARRRAAPGRPRSPGSGGGRDARRSGVHGQPADRGTVARRPGHGARERRGARRVTARLTARRRPPVAQEQSPLGGLTLPGQPLPVEHGTMSR